MQQGQICIHPVGSGKICSDTTHAEGLERPIYVVKFARSRECSRATCRVLAVESAYQTRQRKKLCPLGLLPIVIKSKLAIAGGRAKGYHGNTAH